MHNRSAKRVFAIAGILALLIAALGAYGYYWHYVARQLEAGVEAWAAEQTTLGGQIGFAWDGIDGFPFRFAATFHQPALLWRTPDGEFSWTGADVTAEMAPWNLHAVEVRSAGHHDAALQLPGDAGPWRTAASGFAGIIGFHDTGALRSVTLALQQPDVSLPNDVAAASGEATLRLELPESPPADFKAPLARVGLDLIQLATPPGTRLLTDGPVETLSIDATIMGPIPAMPLRAALGAWRGAGGVVNVSRFAFAQGPLSLTGDATIALDADLQPEGAGTVNAVGLGEAVEILIRDGVIPADRAVVARATVKALEKPGADGKPSAKIGLSLQRQTVSFGPAPLFTLQRVEWP
jgi:hypothetical protein